MSSYEKVMITCMLTFALQLVTGSSGTASSGSSLSAGTEHAEAGATAEGHAEKDSGYDAGIPGPITRLFIIANRGIANLLQDLILVSTVQFIIKHYKDSFTMKIST